MKRYVYTENGISFIEANEKQIADLVLRNVLTPDSTIQDMDTQKWVKIREIKSLMDRVFQPDIKLSFNEPNMDKYFNTGSESILYYVPTHRFIILMLFSSGAFFYYWAYRNWLYLHKSSKIRPGFLTMIQMLLSLRTLFFLLQKEMMSEDRREETFNSERCAVQVYAIMLFGILAIFFGGLPIIAWVAISFIESLLLIMILLPVQKTIADVNQKAGMAISSQSIIYYMIMLYSFVTWIFVALKLSGVL